MPGQLVITGLDGFQTLCRLARRDDNDDGLKAGFGKRLLDPFRIKRSDMAVGDDSAAIPKPQPAAFLPQPGQQARADLDLVTTGA